MTFHIGIIGGGGISETHARAASEIETVQVVAVYGQNADKARRLSELYGGVAYTELDDLLAHQPLDLVAIGSPSGLHAEQGIAAARAGKHVLVEKPIDISTEQADKLIAECDQANVKLGVFFQDRAKPDVRQLKEVINAGKLGAPLLASAHVKWYRPPEYYGSSRWRGTWELDGGGALMNQGVHTIDLLLWMFGDVIRVSAKAKALLHSIEVEDTVVATLEFANGALGTLEATTAAYPGYKRKLELTGSEGTIILEHDRVVACDLRTPLAEGLSGFGEAEADRNLSASSPVVSDVRAHRTILEDFLRAIETNGTPYCDGREARRSVELVQAIYESSQTGKVITLRE